MGTLRARPESPHDVFARSSQLVRAPLTVVRLGSADDGGRDRTPAPAGQRPLVAERIDGYVIRTRGPMCCNPGGDGAFIAPRDEGVDETVAAPAGEVVVAEAEPAEVIEVVLQLEVDRGVLPAQPAGHLFVSSQRDRLLGQNQLV